MTAVTRNGMWAVVYALTTLGLLACGGTPTTDGGTGGGGGGSGGCIEDIDCPDPQLFFCNTTTSECEPSCRVKEDCSDARRGEHKLPFCSGSLGCECDEGKCVGSLCSSDADCGTQVCRNGACVAPPAGVAKCSITPDLVVVREGAKAKFWVSAWDSSNAPVVTQEGATWSAPAGSPLTGSGTGNSIEFTAGTATAGTTAVAAVEAAFGTVKCGAKAIVLPSAVAAGEVAVAVIDELSGRPIPNADVVLAGADGTIVQQQGADFLKTDARGYAKLTGAPAAFSVSAFHSDYTYLTVANYSGSSRFLSLVLRRNQTDKYGGYKGGFGSTVPQTSNVHAAIAGMSIAGSITNLSISQLLGPSVPTDIRIGSAINQMDVPIPAGVFLGFGDQQIKNDFAGQGLAGTCVDGSGNPDEMKIGAGTCGTRTAWALAGDVPLGDLPIDAVAGGLDNINVGALLSRILPIFKKFNSSVVRDVQFDLKATPFTGNEPNFSDQSHFVTRDHNFTQVPLGFSYVAKLPTLPKFKGAFVDGVAIIGGASVPGQGVVPLGIGVGVNTNPVDGQTDTQAELPAPNMVQVRMAPTHHGLEGGEYGLVIAGISAKALTDSSAGLGASAIFARLPNNRLVFDPKGATPVDVSSMSFPVFPEGAKFNFTNAAQGAIPGRSFRFGAVPDLTGINVLRVSFADDREHRWDVLMNPATASAGFTLPAIPSGTAHADRLFANGMASGSRSTLVVQALKLNTRPAGGGAAIDFNGFVEFNDTNADRTTDFLTGFSFLDFGRPSVDFTTPNSSPATIAKGSKVVVEVKNFKIGTTATDDGAVRLTFSLGGNPVAGCDAAVLKTETMAGNGELEYTLPMSCGGTDLSMKAELVGIDETTPIAPAVSKTVTVTIQ
ncbi:MAG: dickkopf-related protein [Myxococcota bacterium]